MGDLSLDLRALRVNRCRLRKARATATSKKVKGMTMEKTTLELCRIVQFDDGNDGIGFPATEWNRIPRFEAIVIRKPALTRLRLTEWFEGAPFFPAIRQRSEPK